ncbi:MAG: class I mannose-6-phosphate isomerase [Planctomycetes bacterium]|nr:class I mannose-6-phosphate isomerase [Planctomycetota bacterium]
MLPMRMQPIYKERVWGGHRLADLLGKDVPADRPIGESWELADHPKGRSLIADGPFAGKTLRWLLDRHADAVVGRNERARGAAARFPLLVKFIDAADRLSVQVHPDDAAAAVRHGGESGKAECWVVLAAEPDAWVVDGLAPAVTRKALGEAIRAGNVQDLLIFRKVAPGDVIWIPVGHVHAAGPGVLLAEIQQNSDLTYRLYDWDRAGLDGKPRDLHVEAALETIVFDGEPTPSGGRGRTISETGLEIEHLVDCHAFSLSRVRLDRRPWAAGTGGTYAAVIVLEGRATLAADDGQAALEPGATLLVPADAGEYAFTDADNLVCLVAAPPGKAPTR